MSAVHTKKPFDIFLSTVNIFAITKEARGSEKFGTIPNSNSAPKVCVFFCGLVVVAMTVQVSVPD